MAILNKASLTSTIPNGVGGTVEVSAESNTHRANNVDMDITIEKSAEQTWAIPESVIRVTTNITNNTDLNIEDITIKDTLGEGASFVAGSITVDSQQYKEEDIIKGFTIPVTLGGSGGSMEISYQIQLDKYIDVNTITNSSTINFELDAKQFNIVSNVLSIDVLHNDISILKTADASVVKTGDILTYTITITNNGQLMNTNVKFIDQLPSDVEFVGNSVKIDGTTYADYDPNVGFALNDINANDTIIIEFKAKVLG